MISTPRLDSFTAGGTEHDNQEAWQESPEKTHEPETAETIATRALALWGITAHRDGDAGNTWLVIGHDQTRKSFPRMLAEPYIVLYLTTGSEDEEITVTRAPADGDVWGAFTGDGTGTERPLLTRPADQLTACVEAIANWITTPLTAAGEILLTALAGFDIPVHTDGMSPSYAIPQSKTTHEYEVYSRPHLLIADRAPSVEHPAGSHTGWVVFHHDANGEPVGEALYAGGDGGPVDCVADSAAAAAAINDWFTSARQALSDELDRELLAEMADLHGRFKDGYTAQDIRSVFYRIYDTFGIFLTCVWEYANEHGFGGNSRFYHEDLDGVFSEVSPDVYRWLVGEQDAPGSPNDWVGAAVGEPTDFPVGDDDHNYARIDRTH